MVRWSAPRDASADPGDREIPIFLRGSDVQLEPIGGRLETRYLKQV